MSKKFGRGVLPTLFTLSILFSASAQEQKTMRVSVGDSVVDGSFMKPFRSQWKVIEIKPDGTREEKEPYSDEVIITSLDGRKVLKQVQHKIGGKEGLTIILDHKTLAPILFESTADDGSYIHIRFNGTQIDVECTGKACPRDITAAPGEVVRRSKKVEEPVFDYFAGFYGMLFAGLPLKEGLSVSLPVYHPVRGMIRLDAEVKGEEMLSVGSKKIKVWAIRTPAQPNVTNYVSKEPPYWIKYVNKKPDGSFQIYERP